MTWQETESREQRREKDKAKTWGLFYRVGGDIVNGYGESGEGGRERRGWGQDKMSRLGHTELEMAMSYPD